jgi:hypothetical protein
MVMRAPLRPEMLTVGVREVSLSRVQVPIRQGSPRGSGEAWGMGERSGVEVATSQAGRSKRRAPRAKRKRSGMEIAESITQSRQMGAD